ncbi:DUF559 domain-containing protein [Lysobacter sp. HX-5-24]|uniref:DUF559 domain-containing protein n=1 Tax=Noviluteimonas gilva TaxID=2682097 RepID=A0A7C9LHE4_9GAMM|nr:DUF559 domain-containing protein [Lysobacter gilvus]MUV13059.1 DUF559 domain-containing protein [Lysobacter gilvus]
MQPIWIHARLLRNNATLCERRLWRHLRARRLGGHRFRRQYPIAGYIADFACVEARVVVELDGSQHADARAYDALRTRRMETNGYRVLRFWNNALLQQRDAVLGVILKVCDERAR